MYLPVDPLPGQQRRGRGAVWRSRTGSEFGVRRFRFWRSVFSGRVSQISKKFSPSRKKASRSLSNLQLSLDQQVLISPQSSRTTLDQKRSKKNVILCGHVGYVS